MSDTVREMTRDELITANNELRKQIKELELQLAETRKAVESNRDAAEAEEERLKSEVRYRDGVIHGLEYAMKCNGVSGGEIDRREYQ